MPPWAMAPSGNQWPPRAREIPAGVERLEMGGTAEGNQRARADSWGRLVSFLDSSLMRRSELA